MDELENTDRSGSAEIRDAVIVGAGLGGIGAAAKLIEAGQTNIAVIEAECELGGVWRRHRYPNVACDTPIDLYAYSFFPGNKWSANFAPGNEILAYLNELADQYQVRSRITFNTHVSSMSWDDTAGCWHVMSDDGRAWRARVAIWSGGLFSQPALPPVKGLDRFGGEWFHTSDWQDDIDLSSKRVAVVGGGATSIQVVPYAAKHAEKLFVFVRTPSYVMPRPDISFQDQDRTSPEFAAQQSARREEWFKRFEIIAKSRFPMNPEVIAEQEAVWQEMFDAQVTDPHARDVLTPDYRFGCKRPLFSTDYYPAVQRENVELIGRGVSTLTEDSIVDVEGKLYPIDIVIWATGFEPTKMMGNLVITGKDGRVLSQEWSEVPHAYFGTMVEGFPNFFMICGPNGGGASVTDMVETQTKFIVETMARLKDRNQQIVEVTPDAYATYNADIQARADASVMVKGNCVSYYRVGGTGKMFTHWPDTIEAFRNRVAGEALSGVAFRTTETHRKHENT